MNDLPPPSNRLIRTAAVTARWSFKLLLVMLLVFTAAWGALHLWIVPRIAEFRPQLEIQAGKALGVPVRIGTITARSEGLIPSFELVDVALLDPQGREALRLPRVVAALSPRSVWNLGFDQLYLDKPFLDVRRAGGRIYVAGLDLTRDGANDGRAADWFFSQTEFVISQGTVRWTDEQRAAEPLTLTQVDVVLRNSARRHNMRLDATPPAEWGERFSLRGMFRQPLLSTRSGQWMEWDGQVFGEFSRIDVSRVRRYADLGVEVSEGNGALRVWADLRKGKLTGGMADLALAEVAATLGPELQPLALQSVAGRLGGRLLAGGFEFSTEGLQFQTREGLRWPGGNVSLRYTRAEGQAPAQGDVKADRLDLAAVAQVAQRLPLGTATHAALTAYAPRGLVETVQANWKGEIGKGAPGAPGALQFQAKGRVVKLELAARHGAMRNDVNPPREAAGTPGIKGAGVDFDVTHSGGRLKLDMQGGVLEFPGVFEEPVIPLEQMQADVQWQIEGERISLDIPSLKFSNADATGEARATWRTGDPAGRGRFPGVLDLQGSMSRAAGTRVYRYLPASISKEVREYVRNAVVKGNAANVRFRVKGDLHDMPFADPKLGDFRIAADVSDVTLAYVPRSIQPREAREWPALQQLAGELVFERKGMRVSGASSRMAGAPGLQFGKIEAQIPDLAHTTVLVRADGRGPLGEVLGMVMASPLGAMAGPALETATANGSADYSLILNLPVATIDKSRVQGSITLAGNDVQVSPATPMLGRARGVVTFTETGFGVTGGQARMLGGDVRLEGGTRTVPGTPAETATVLRAQGNFTAEGLKQARELGFLSRIAQNTSGGASYAAVLGVRRGVPELMVTSNLQGLALNLPAPFNKPADSVLPLRFENTLVRDPVAAPAGAPARLQDQLLVELGRVVSISYVRDLSGPEARVVRGGIAVGLLPGESAPAPEDGVVANVNLASVNLDAWENLLSGAAGTSMAAAAAEPQRAASGAAGASAALSYLPTSMAIRAKELTMEGRTLHNVVVGGSREGLVWRANVDAAELNGYVEYRQPSGAGAGRLYARLARLTIAPGSATDVESLLNEQPASIPALDIVVDDLELRGRKFGRVEVEAINRGPGAVAREGGVREWRLNKLNVTLPEASFSATGNWAAINAQAVAPGGPRPARAPAERRRTVMNFRLDINDSGALLSRFGMKDVIRRGKGRMEGQVAWVGSPLSLDYPTLNGNFNVNMESGQFLKADPGLAKLLGVLSLQSLPRRLALDFRDVFSEGFAFDFVRGDVTIEDGEAATNNLQMKGVNAAVLMEGRADIAKETQDIKVVVVPEINAGTASLVATVINPAIGIGTFLAQYFLRRPLIEATTQEFHITGTWADPKIAKVARRQQQGQAAPDAAAGASTGATR